MSQADQIRAYLNTGRELTALQALNKFGCMRLAARVEDLKHIYGEGSILTERRMVNGKLIGVYHGTSLLKRRKAA